ncbi:hypothetical protein FVEG_01209 [Fusarium verticillioides 7600]|uniref:Uncharacterized protein n=1 Tax=Gibberella moniliformis (strain M3125 / FGSC 7600) TaxID=334819 RepID=W7LQB5_GIBM7|nr:hypothetical protein FVEG_01209 [Fusarium verticillioides 7600]EWG37684.1 hypothetical protein FVEG_01209 [Fusarium verticillioides 7600]
MALIQKSESLKRKTFDFVGENDVTSSWIAFLLTNWTSRLSPVALLHHWQYTMRLARPMNRRDFLQLHKLQEALRSHAPLLDEKKRATGDVSDSLGKARWNSKMSTDCSRPTKSYGHKQ